MFVLNYLTCLQQKVCTMHICHPKKITHHLTGAVNDEYQQYLPAKYNSESELEMEVHVNGANHFEFALVSK